MSQLKALSSSATRARLGHNVSALLMAFAAIAGGCANTNQPADRPFTQDSVVRADPQVSPRLVTPLSEPAQRDWDEAMHALSREDFRGANALFERFSQNYPLDNAAHAAVFYAVYAQLRAGDLPAARSRLQALTMEPNSDEIRGHAYAYLALIQRMESDARSARQVLESGLQILPNMHVRPGQVVQEDLSALASLLADTRIRGRQFEAALRDLEVVYTYDTEMGLREWALSSAVTLAREGLDDQTLERLVRAESTFQRAVAVTAYVPRLLARGELNAATAAFQGGAQALLAHEMEASYAALANTLTLSGSEFSPIYGVAVSLTGPDRRAGRAALGGMLLAQQAFDGKARMSDLWIEDSGGYAEGAARAVDNLCARGVPVIVGPIEPALAPAARTAAERCGAVYIGLDNVAAEGSDHYRMSFNAQEEARLLVSAGRDHGALRWLIVNETPPADYFDALERATREEVSKIGGTVVGAHRVDIEDLQSSSREVAQAVRRSGADAVVFVVSSPTMTTLSNYLAAAGVWPQTASAAPARGRSATISPLWLGASFAWGSDVQTNAARNVEGMFIASWLPMDRPATALFVERFTSVYGRAPGMLEAFAFDATHFARQVVLEHGVRDGRTLQQRLQNGFVFEGVTGVWTWSRQGLSHPPALQRVSAGAPRTQ